MVNLAHLFLLQQLRTSVLTDGTVPAGDLLPGARIRGGDRYAYTMVNRQVNGNIIVRREIEGARATLRPTDRVVRTARSRMRSYMPPSTERRNSR